LNFFKGPPSEPADAPVAEQLRAEAAVEAEGGLVPIEHGPLHPAPTTRDREPGQMREQQSADALAALILAHVQVLQVESRAAEERGEVREEQREADRIGP